ncbi:unnamed protein product [Pipistrellus nathusii]|uniref:Uncharacterized protein n=1 Tax=Pipistrellus nathusii TaxID=59473 RepID=A0ABP0A1N0_PIPNA
MKCHRTFSSSDSSDETPSTSLTGSVYRNKSKIPNEHKNSTEVFQNDLMTLLDFHHINPITSLRIYGNKNGKRESRYKPKQALFHSLPSEL